MDKSQRTKFMVAGSAALVTFIVFLPSLLNEFVNWDDNYYIYQNPFIRSLNEELLKYAFAGFHEANWHPLTWISHAVDYAVWGLNPLGHHLTNNILHSLNTFLVVLLAAKLIEISTPQSALSNQTPPPGSLVTRASGKPGTLPDYPWKRPDFPRDSRLTLIAAGITGLLFGLHPLHVESVVWAAERKDVLCAFFFLAALLTYTSYASENAPDSPTNFARRLINKKYLVTMAFFVLSLLSKPMAVSLPFVLLILDWYPLGRLSSFRTSLILLVEKLPFFGLALISSVVTILAQEAGDTIRPLEMIPMDSRLMVAGKSLISYLAKMIVPLNLVPFYPYAENISFSSPEVVIPVVLVIAITATCIAVMRTRKLWLSVWSYYVITLMPVLGIMQVGSQAMADRYTYLPSLGPFLVAGVLAARIWLKISESTRWRSLLRFLCGVITLGILFFLAFATIRQIGVWKNSETLWTYVIEKEPSNFPLAYKNRAIHFLTIFQLEKALADCEIYLTLRPYDDGNIWRKIIIGAYYDRGNYLLKEGEKELAVADFRKACDSGNQKGCDALKDLSAEMR